MSTSEATTALYGSWVSPVSADMLTGATVGLSAPSIDGGDVYWIESRAAEGGRMSVWRRTPDDTLIEVTPAPFNVRTRVHEYGGGAYAVDNGIVVFSHFTDGRLYRVGPAGEPEPFTPAPPTPNALRYADLRVHANAGLVLAVREDHRGDGEPVSTIVALDLDGENPDGGTVLCEGADFYAAPEWSGEQLAWVQWQHPNMPWDSTELQVAPYDGATRGEPRLVAGGPGESAVAPTWTPGGRLVFSSDRSDWWNLYVDGVPDPLVAEAAEYALPLWQLGQHPQAVVSEHQLISVRVRDGHAGLVLVDEASATASPVTSAAESAADVAYENGLLACVLRRRDAPARLVVRDLGGPLDAGSWQTLRTASEVDLDPGLVSTAEPVTWTGEQGEVHGWFYPPTNAGFSAPEGTLPPLRVEIHGGPTAMAGDTFNLEYQYWTSRGFAVLDVNYGGSTGWGRAYRERLQGTWGDVDVADCATGAVAMGTAGRADPDRFLIAGGSAGGYTVLRALTTSDVFAAGVSSYGIGDLETLARDTHKFESRYTDGLVGPYPEAAALYRERSPIHHLDRLSSPMLLLQGLDDQVVPPNQAEEMATAVRAKGLPVALIMFAGEGHGFRAAETIRTALQAELYFLGRVLGFTPADELTEIAIDNLR